MKTKGFTLIEMLGAVILLSAVSLIAIPYIIEQLDKSKNRVDEATFNMITLGTEQYISYNQTKYPKVNGNTYCITLQKIVDNGNLVAPIKNMRTSKEIPLTTYVEVKVSNKEYNYVISTNCKTS